MLCTRVGPVLWDSSGTVVTDFVTPTGTADGAAMGGKAFSSFSSDEDWWCPSRISAVPNRKWFYYLNSASPYLGNKLQCG